MKKFFKAAYEFAADVLMIDNDPMKAVGEMGLVMFQFVGIATTVIGFAMVALVVLK